MKVQHFSQSIFLPFQKKVEAIRERETYKGFIGYTLNVGVILLYLNVSNLNAAVEIRLFQVLILNYL